MKYYQRGKNNDATKHNIGKSPNFKALNNARKTLLHHMTYNRNRELLNYSNCPDDRYYSNQSINGDYECQFFVIFPVRGKPDNEIKVGFNLTTWDNYDATANCNFEWDNVDAPNLLSENVTISSNQTSSFTLSGYDKPNGISASDEITLDYDHNDIGGYGYTRVSFDHLVPASFTSWIRPIDESDYSAIDTQYGDQAFGLVESAFNIGQSLRGSSAYNDSNGSVGTLCQRQFDDGDSGQNMVSNSDLCLFQWGHPSGLFVQGAGGSLAYEPMFPYDIKIRGRELIEDNAGFFDVVMVYRADVDTALKVHVGSTATDHTIALTTTSTTVPAKTVLLTGIPFDGSGDDLTISCLVSLVKAVEIKTIAIFESTY